MQPNPSHTALLLFVRSEAQELRAKSLSLWGGRQGNRQLIQLLNRHARRVALRTHLPIFVISGEQQRGATFGERYANALQDVFAQGYEQIISIGNDCLGLRPEDLLQVQEGLAHSSLVLGPDQRGGAYVIGIRREVFEAESWMSLPWQTGQLCEALVQYATQKKASVEALPARMDVNHAADLAVVFQRLAPDNWLYRQLKQLFRALRLFRLTFRVDYRLERPPLLSHLRFRGPPANFSF